MYVEWKVAVGFVTTKILLLEVSSSLTKATASASTANSTSSLTTASIASNAIVHVERKMAVGAAVAVASAVALFLALLYGLTGFKL